VAAGRRGAAPGNSVAAVVGGRRGRKVARAGYTRVGSELRQDPSLRRHAGGILKAPEAWPRSERLGLGANLKRRPPRTDWKPVLRLLAGGILLGAAGLSVVLGPRRLIWAREGRKIL